MKRNSYISTICVAMFLISFVCALSSCENESVDISRSDVQFSIRVADVISPFQAYKAPDKDMYSESGIPSKINILCLLYDDSGHLLNEFSQTISEYNSNLITFSSPVSGSNPVLVCFSYATWTNKSGKIFKAYDITGKESLSTLRVESDLASEVNLIPWQVLGGAIVQLGATSQNISVSLKPLGGLVYLSWENIHSHDKETPPPTRYVMMYKNNDVVMINNKEFTYSSTLATTYYFYSEVFPANNKTYNTIYSVQFMMPCNVETFGFGGYYMTSRPDEEKILGRTDDGSIMIDAQKQYVFIMDCKNYTIELKQGIMD